MKKSIKNILIVMMVAVLFISCNADMGKYGIFQSMMYSKPDTGYTIRAFKGLDNAGNFIIETADGIEILDKSGNKTTKIHESNATLIFKTTTDTLYSYVDKDNGNKVVTYLANDTFGDPKEVTLKVDGKPVDVLHSYYDDGNYYLRLQTQDPTPQYYIAKVTDSANYHHDTATDVLTLNNVKATTSLPYFIGNGYYYVIELKDGKTNYKLANIADSTTKDLQVRPLVAVDDFLIVEGKYYTIDSSLNLTNEKEHKIDFYRDDEDRPVAIYDETVYGIIGNKPFDLKGREYSTIGSGVSVRDIYVDGDTIYAFTEFNGLLKSTDGGKTFN